ncbi:MAG: VanW family protein [Anaerolineae bacterium]|nr:VanW family protein [Thermoflexales bacterium]MDW8054616.1 VanW family protein [Anaerolineae bacterium]MDW8292950.1 VanW family protein [Anaerolineae bacterium]
MVWLRAFAVSLLAVAGIALSVGFGYYEIALRDRIVPGVRVGGIAVGGMTPEEALMALQDARAQQEARARPLRLSVASQQFVLRSDELGAAPDLAEAVRQAWLVGREGDLITRWRARLLAWWRGVEVSAVLYFDEGTARNRIAEIARQVERPPRDADVRVEGSKVIEVPSEVGLELNEEATLQLVRTFVARGHPSEAVMPHRLRAPQRSRASQVADEARTILSGDVQVLVPQWDQHDKPSPAREAFRIRAEDLARMFTLVEEQGELRIEWQRDQLRALVAPLASVVERPPQNARFTFDPSTQRLTPIVPAREGRALDVEASVEAIIQAAGRSSERRAMLVVRTTAPEIPTEATAQQLGITALITEATTYFKGSSPARLANVRTAASRFHGVVIPPGAVFSFNALVGEISREEGFEEGLIIVGDRTVRGVGGGVCQVSTTAYQAALRAGFPILERHPHGYRVSYYERGMGPGFDASVYSPWADLKFRNDLNSHLLIETYYDPSRVTLTFRFYGTPDGREVIISRPTITNVVPHGPDIYEPDMEGEVPPGQAKQVEFAVDGATIWFTRTVTRGGQVLINERVVSRYVPWQNVFRYGPGFAPPPNAVVRQ